MNNNKKYKITYIVLFLCSFAFGVLAHAKTYRWVDKKGQIHYSQTMPPSEAQSGHEELNEKTGMTVNQVESSDIKKQRLKKAQLENERNAEKKLELQEELMVYMFSSKKELVTHFEERLKMISVNIRLLQFHRKQLTNSIKETTNRIQRVKSDNAKKKLKKTLHESQNSLLDHSRAVQINEDERDKIIKQMDRAVKVYDKKFGNTELNVGSLIGTSVLESYRNTRKVAALPSATSEGEKMCSCPCTASK